MLDSISNQAGFSPVLLYHKDELRIFQSKDLDGYANFMVFSVFPGIQMVFIDAHRFHILLPLSEEKEPIFSIQYCKEASLHGTWDGYAYTLKEGALGIFCPCKASDSSYLYFPSGIYKGLVVHVNLKESPPCLSHLLDGMHVWPARIPYTLCKDCPCCILKSSPEIQAIFSPLYLQSAFRQPAYHKLKILELFLYLNQIAQQDQPQGSAASLPAIYVRQAKEISGYLLGHLDTYIPLKKLGQIFHISPSHLKAIFLSVYGISPSQYQRKEKMKVAAQLLLETEYSIQEIAGTLGYDNASKFSAAFRSVTGVTPRQYRKEGRSLS